MALTRGEQNSSTLTRPAAATATTTATATSGPSSAPSPPGGRYKYASSALCCLAMRGEVLALGTDHAEVLVFDLRKHDRPLSSHREHQGRVSRVCVSSSKRVFSSADDGLVVRFALDADGCDKEFACKALNAPVSSIAVVDSGEAEAEVFAGLWGTKPRVCKFSL
eukprot:TRINITY_DN8692_c0_g1_i2.p2 TRINITY_DN8692_c0_g1~~TRINITY_DN8692_c0_g1_i2.p2  ORF type:complete len:165 (+),score=49.17 TRINITY_DN8692_c0_g1_i2:235-729(+)